MAINTKYRSDETEIMDDFALEGEMLIDALDKIAKINKSLGGNYLTLQGVEKLLSPISKKDEITFVDVGCGNRDMLRMLADYASKKNFKFRLIGVDANPFTITHARDLSQDYLNISYQCEDVFKQSFRELKYDILLCTLTLHHFKDDALVDLISVFNRNATIGVVINDLHRHYIAYQLFRFLCFAFSWNEMTRDDGLTSILRGFKKEELIAFSEKANLKKYTIHWKWAFRYQWIIFK